MINPINVAQEQQVIAATSAYIELASRLFDRDFEQITVSFDLTGRAAGIYQVSGRQRRIRYNPYIFARFFEENLLGTVPHEVAHYVTDAIYHTGKRAFFSPHRVKPHGKEWQQVMRKFGANPSRTCSFDISGLPVRNYSYHLYSCDCRQHQLGSRRHNRVVRQQANYACKKCGGRLRQQTELIPAG